jgi:hypothetical protein
MQAFDIFFYEENLLSVAIFVLLAKFTSESFLVECLLDHVQKVNDKNKT